jgi:hypothetical protein
VKSQGILLLGIHEDCVDADLTNWFKSQAHSIFACGKFETGTSSHADGQLTLFRYPFKYSLGDSLGSLKPQISIYLFQLQENGMKVSGHRG